MLPESIVQVSCGYFNTLFLLENSEIWGTGYGGDGQLCRLFKTVFYTSQPFEIVKVNLAINPNFNNEDEASNKSQKKQKQQQQKTSSNESNSFNDQDNISVDSDEDTQSDLDDEDEDEDYPIALFSGGWHHGVLDQRGRMFTWGYSLSGRLGYYSKGHPQAYEEACQATPLQVPFDNDVVAAAGGGANTVFLINSNKIVDDQEEEEEEEE
eukprot:TRINITY_DN12628_c0_g1_i1.p1 TRINITY_DN12628_c0_g1~~TRINITY_DN12628_c0_g1_i1.p1  ORF type:complete len:210 (+),score=79.99 TRINITY_DN12628_c0_g1_i1:351-980(+)